MARGSTKATLWQADGQVLDTLLLGDGEHLIGRDPGCDIVLNDAKVSRQHVRLILSREGVEIEDLDSTHGTFVDNIRIKGRVPVNAGQQIRLSDLYLTIEHQVATGLGPGTQLGKGRFTLTRFLGKGGMGQVWQAEDKVLETFVALKLLPDEASGNPEALKDLERELRRTRELPSPYIVTIHELWHEPDEPAFISMEYVAGTDLHKVRGEQANGVLPWVSVQLYMFQLCDALDFAHGAKVAHRDIKPANLMITGEGQLKLADFGLAASLSDFSTKLTTLTLSSGTPQFMSPQQMEGKRPAATDDIYSIGATFYELLTGKPPFYSGDIAYQVRNVDATPVQERLKEFGINNEVPDYVAAMVMACLQKDPAKRPQSAGTIRDWIKTQGISDMLGSQAWGNQESQAGSGGPAVLPGQKAMPQEAPPADSLETGQVEAALTPTTRKAKTTKRKKIRAYGVAAALAVIGIMAAVFWGKSDKQESEKQAWLTNGQISPAKTPPAALNKI